MPVPCRNLEPEVLFTSTRFLVKWVGDYNVPVVPSEYKHSRQRFDRATRACYDQQLPQNHLKAVPVV